jgi:hypothetical protein
MTIKLSTLSILLGLGMIAPNLYALANPSKFTAAARKFPRSVPIGTVLMVIATLWFVLNVRNESIADFESMKPFLYTLFVAVGIGTCIFVKDFLAARGLAVCILLLAQLMVETARWAESEWRLVIMIWAYVWVVAGIWFTISPWRVRDMINWNVADEKRLRLLSGIRLAFGLFVAALGFLAFK